MSKQSKPAESRADDIKKTLPQTLGVRASPDDVLELFAHLRAGVPLVVAAAAAGIPIEETRSPALAYLIAKTEAEYEADLMKIVSRAAIRDWHAAVFLLERRFPERWGRHQTEQRVRVESTSARVRVAVAQGSPEAQAAPDVEAERPPAPLVGGAE